MTDNSTVPVRESCRDNDDLRKVIDADYGIQINMEDIYARAFQDSVNAAV